LHGGDDGKSHLCSFSYALISELEYKENGNRGLETRARLNFPNFCEDKYHVGENEWRKSTLVSLYKNEGDI